MFLKRLLAALIASSVAACAGAIAEPATAPSQLADAGPSSMCDRSFPTIDALHEDVRADPQVTPGSQNDQYVAYTDSSERRTWTFTRPAHPAHPSVVCRTMGENDIGFFVTSQIGCFNTDQACNQLRADFEQMDRDMQDDMRRRGLLQGPTPPAPPAGAAGRQLCGRTFSSVEQLIDQLRRDPQVAAVAEDQDYQSFIDRTTPPEPDVAVMGWVFTKPGHEAHPAAICRKIHDRVEPITVSSDIYCPGPRDACQALAMTVSNQDDALVRKMMSDRASRL